MQYDTICNSSISDKKVAQIRTFKDGSFESWKGCKCGEECKATSVRGWRSFRISDDERGAGMLETMWCSDREEGLFGRRWELLRISDLIIRKVSK